MRDGLAAGLDGIALTGTETACAYVPSAREPGSLALVDVLAGRVARVLLPVSEEGGVLDWAAYGGSDELVRGRFGLREPSGPRGGARAVAEAHLLLVPALAVDARGVRLGRGGGYYDRALAGAGQHAVVIAVVRDEERVAALPAEPHDVRVSAVLTPGCGMVWLAT